MKFRLIKLGKLGNFPYFYWEEQISYWRFGKRTEWRKHNYITFASEWEADKWLRELIKARTPQGDRERTIVREVDIE